MEYNSDDVKDVLILKHHTQSTRSCNFSPNGLLLSSGSKDNSIAIIDTNGQIVLHQKNAHKEPINLVQFLNDDVLISGDDNGTIKIWDLKSSQCVYEGKEQTETITGVTVSQDFNFLLTTSLDGSLSVYDIRKANSSKDKLYALSDCMEEDLTSICLVKDGKFVATSSSEGNILLFKWDWFGDFKDRVLLNTASIDTMIKLDENTLITGGEDGFVRGVSVFPNKQLQILGEHEEDDNFPITKIALSHCKNILASISHDNSIKFYDVQQFVNKRMKIGQNTWEGYVSGDENESNSVIDEENKSKKGGKNIEENDSEFSDIEEEDNDNDDENDQKKDKIINKKLRLSDKALNKVKQKQKIQKFFNHF
ncbi:WD repeat protein [Ichthyophthirius multifiliis]|uniref:WD repeat protein n=1 Tax=Ichthyophthirius multifiliis TaxID=5932 RepID=G0R5H4_ICHMU|nr:WD repeat protein [Ichthyophthirius multifiliis]EGR27280.1 WD repeat protein [Ichthyophthirius multifiliis]|eukprot:XP_004024164.1 WD repeat protein [Ichthyophthirius multifiliis]